MDKEELFDLFLIITIGYVFIAFIQSTYQIL